MRYLIHISIHELKVVEWKITHFNEHVWFKKIFISDLEEREKVYLFSNETQLIDKTIFSAVRK